MAARFSAFRHRDFALFWSASVVSRIGTQMRDVALGWHVYLLTHSPLALGLVGAARVLPIVVFALGGGVAADSLDRRRLMIATQSILAATSAGLALLTHGGLIQSTGLLYAMVALSAATVAFDSPSRQSLVVDMLPPEDVSNGLTLSILGWQLATVIGPAVAGLLLGVTSVQAIYAIDALSFAGVIGALAVVRPRRPPVSAPPPPQSSGADKASSGGATRIGVAIADGVRFLRANPPLVWLMLLDFFATFFGGAMQLMPVFANDIFAVGARGLGLLVSAPAVGSLVASAWLSWRPPLRRHGPVVLGAVTAYGLFIAAFGLSPSFALALVLLAGSGAADTVSTVVRQVVRHAMTPDAMRGRMVGMNMIFFIGGPQLGEVEAGFVAERTTPRTSVVSGGVACVVAALAMALLLPGLRALGRGPHPRPRPQGGEATPG